MRGKERKRKGRRGSSIIKVEEKIMVGEKKGSREIMAEKSTKGRRGSQG